MLHNSTMQASTLQRSPSLEAPPSCSSQKRQSITKRQLLGHGKYNSWFCAQRIRCDPFLEMRSPMLEVTLKRSLEVSALRLVADKLREVQIGGSIRESHDIVGLNIISQDYSKNGSDLSALLAKHHLSRMHILPLLKPVPPRQATKPRIPLSQRT